jgi:hypothetical protein
VFDVERVPLIRELSDEVKLGSGEAGDPLMRAACVGFTRVFIGSGINFGAIGPPFLPMACVTAYPALAFECALAIAVMHGYHVAHPWGYSDHAIGTDCIEFALACGASVIEAHVALAWTDKRLACDKTPNELREIVAMAKGEIPLVTHAAETRRKAAERFVGRWSHGR